MSRHKQARRKIMTSLYRRRGFLWSVGIFLGVVLLVLLAFRLSPWPGALIIRWDFDYNAQKMKQALDKHEPQGVVMIANQQYKSGDKDAYLDVYFPENISANDMLPVLIWTHGGAWLSGDKTNVTSYYKLIAARGFVVVSVNYTLAPSASYPHQIYQLNEAHDFVRQNAARFHADTGQIMLAGDSAGAQLSAQMAALITNPAYAQEVGLTPSFQPEQLKGVVLNCGIYKMEELAHPNPQLSRLIGWGQDVTVWAYSGTHDFSKPIIRQMSPYYHVTKDFPPTYITGGNNDPLTDVQSKPLAEKLASHGVSVTTLFYEPNHQPGLPHEYQFNLDNEDGQRALEATIDFMKSRVQ